jgi:hypothetical protein
MSHLRDFVHFEGEWWAEFVEGTGRAQAVVSTPREVSEAILAAWLTHQVAPSLSVMHDLYPDRFVKDLIATGRVRRGMTKRLQLLLSGKGRPWEARKDG